MSYVTQDQRCAKNLQELHRAFSNQLLIDTRTSYFPPFSALLYLFRRYNEIKYKEAVMTQLKEVKEE